MSLSTKLSRQPRRIDIDAPLHRKAGPTAHAMRPVESAGEAQTPRACSATCYLTNNEAAAFLRLSPRTLEKHRVIGGGPRFHKFGRRVMYALSDLEAWAGERSFETTFDPEYLDRHPGAQRDDQ